MTRIEDCLHQCKLLLVGARITACAFAESISVQPLRDLGHQALYDHEKILFLFIGSKRIADARRMYTYPN